LAKYCPECGASLAPQVIAGRERLACPACGYVWWDNPVPVVAAIVERGGRVLLARKKEWAPGRWGLVAGFPEAGETMEEAVRREVHEETSLQATLLGLVGVYSLPQRNQVFIVYRVQAAGPWQASEELEALREFERAEIAEVLANLPPQSGAGRALRDWLAAGWREDAEGQA
jgi:NAD+ diphosphatase